MTRGILMGPSTAARRRHPREHVANFIDLLSVYDRCSFHMDISPNRSARPSTARDATRSVRLNVGAPRWSRRVVPSRTRSALPIICTVGMSDTVFWTRPLLTKHVMILLSTTRIRTPRLLALWSEAEAETGCTTSLSSTGAAIQPDNQYL